MLVEERTVPVHFPRSCTHGPAREAQPFQKHPSGGDVCTILPMAMVLLLHPGCPHLEAIEQRDTWHGRPRGYPAAPALDPKHKCSRCSVKGPA